MSSEFVRPVLKIKLTPGQVRSAIRLSVIGEESTAVGNIAVLEAKLREEREAELQAALTVPAVTQQVHAKGPSSPASSTEGRFSHHSDIEEVGGGIPTEETPLVHQ